MLKGHLVNGCSSSLWGQNSWGPSSNWIKIAKHMAFQLVLYNILKLRQIFFISFSSELEAWKEIYHNNYVSVSFPFSIIKTSWAESGNGKRYLHFSAQRIRNSIFALSSTPLPLPTVIALRRKQSKDINFKSIFFFKGLSSLKIRQFWGAVYFFCFCWPKRVQGSNF